MDKEIVERRKKTIMNIINARLRGGKINARINDEVDESLEGEFGEDYKNMYYGTEEEESTISNAEYGYFEDAITSDSEYLEADRNTSTIRKMIANGCTLDEIGDYIEESGDIAILDFYYASDCKRTPEDDLNEHSMEDEDVLALYGKEIDPFEGFNQYDVARTFIVEQGLSINDIPEKLLFDLYFVDAYINEGFKALSMDPSIRGVMFADVERATKGVRKESFDKANENIQNLLGEKDKDDKTEEK